MGRKRDLTTIEKDQIVKLLSNQKTTIEIARMLSRDHRAIKNFVQRASKVRSRSDKGHFRIINKKGNDSFEDGNCSKPTYDVSKVFQ